MYSDSKYDYLLNERINNPKDSELGNEGYKFITNFYAEDEKFYLQASKDYGLNFRIENETFNRSGRKMDNRTKSFYVDSNIYNLSDFWKVFDQISKQ